MTLILPAQMGEITQYAITIAYHKVCHGYMTLRPL